MNPPAHPPPIFTPKKITEQHKSRGPAVGPDSFALSVAAWKKTPKQAPSKNERNEFFAALLLCVTVNKIKYFHA